MTGTNPDLILIWPRRSAALQKFQLQTFKLLQGPGPLAPGQVGGGALRGRGSAQSHHPGGVAAKILGQRGINPDCAARSGRVRRPDEPCGGFKDRRLISQHGRLGQPTLPNFPDYPFQTKSTLLSIRGSRLWWTGQPRAADSRSFLRAHFLHRLHRHSLQLDAMPFCHDAHNRGHACGNGRCHQVGWRKAFPLPFVIHRGIGSQLGSGRAMNRFAVKLPLVTNGDFDRQGRISSGRRPGSGPTRRRCPKGT
ncbi:MAG: hypothetical protein RL549_1222 [Verrucomicrobiota bacterium]